MLDDYDFEYNLRKNRKLKNVRTPGCRYVAKGNGFVVKFIHRNSKIQNEEDIEDKVAFKENNLK